MDLRVSHISKDKYLANSSSKRTGRVAMNCFMHLCTHSTNSSIENHAIVYMVYIVIKLRVVFKKLPQTKSYLFLHRFEYIDITVLLENGMNGA